MGDPLLIAGKEFESRIMVGTGRHRTMDEMVSSIEASGAQIITVAIGRLNLDDLSEKSILDYFDWDKYTILPNTAGSKTAAMHEQIMNKTKQTNHEQIKANETQHII